MASEEELQLTLQLRDQFSDGLRDIQAELDRLHAKLRAATDGTSNATEADINRLGDQIRTTENDSRTLTAAIGKLDRHVDELGDEAAQTSGQLNRMSAASGKTSKGFSGVMAMGRGAAGGIAAAGAAALVAVVGFAKLNTAVGQYQQNVTKSKAVFGNQIGSMRRWARAHRDDFGGSTQDVLTYAASLQDLIVPMGFGRKEATGMTKDLGSLVPVLTEWDKSGRSAEEITDILAASLTGERDALKTLGVTISEDGIKKQIELMRSQGKLKGATDEQAEAQATLALLYKKTGDAQATYKDNADSVVRRTRDVEYQVKQLRDNGLKVLLGVWQRTSRALNKTELGEPIKALGRWVNQHRDDIVGFFLQSASVAAKAFSIWAKWESIIIKGLGYVLGAISTTTHYLGYFVPGLEGVSQATGDAADKMGGLSQILDTAAKKGGAMSTALQNEADAAHTAQKRVDDLRAALDKVHNKTIKIRIRTTMKGVWSAIDAATEFADNPTGDTLSPWGGPRLGAAGLAAAHAHYADGRGMRVTSGIRDWNLGSTRSDHRAGRAMDVRGPFLGAYAARVRESGGYAAMHGVGPGRHLHVAPRGMPEPGGGDSTVYDIDIHTGGAPVRPFDLRNAVDAGIRQAERRRAERGGR